MLMEDANISFAEYMLSGTGLCVSYRDSPVFCRNVLRLPNSLWSLKTTQSVS